MIAILGDIHGDREMFSRALRSLPGNVERLVVLGDVIGSPADAEIVERLHHIDATMILGHCEAEALGLIRTQENPSTHDTREEHRLSPRIRQLIQTWPVQSSLAGATFVHGSMRHPLKSSPLTEEEGRVEKTFLHTPLVFRGHLHQPALVAINQDKIIQAPWTWHAEILLVGAEHWIITIPACSSRTSSPGYVLWDPPHQRMWFISLADQASLGETRETQ